MLKMSFKKDTPMLVGYARVSTQEQNLDLQIHALEKAGCEKIYTEKASGAKRDRPELINVLDYTHYRSFCERSDMKIICDTIH